MKPILLSVTRLCVAVQFASSINASAQTPTPTATPTAQYRADDLGTVSVTGLNDRGEVIGSDFWTGDSVLYYRGTKTNPSFYGWSINNSGVMSGSDATTFDSGFWTPDSPGAATGSFNDVDLGFTTTSINNLNEVAGTHFTTGMYGFRYDINATTTDLDTLGGDSIAKAINNKSQIAGIAYTTGDAEGRPVIWNSTTPTDLGVPSGAVADAVGINDNGDVVGWTSPDGSSAEAYLYSDATLSLLGRLDSDDDSRAQDINNAGEVVGASTSYTTGFTRWFKYTTTDGMVDLNTQVDPSLNWLLTTPQAINDCGQIVGQGYHYDRSTDTYLDTDGLHAVLLSPRGIGMVFQPDPVTASNDPTLIDDAGADSDLLTAQRHCVKLLGLDGTGYLQGEYATTSGSFLITRVHPSDGVYDYTRSETGFEEVMAYYHTDAVTRYVAGLGFVDSGVPKYRNGQVVLDVSNPDFTDDANYNHDSGVITFGSGGGLSEGPVDSAEDGEVIWHENFHSLVDQIVPGFSYGSGSISIYREARAINEGSADYWAASAFAGQGPVGHENDWDAYFGKWLGTSSLNAFDPMTPTIPPYIRLVNSTKVYPTNYVDNDTAHHENGEIWSSALWAIRQLSGFGRTRVDKTLLRAFEEAGDFIVTPQQAHFRDLAKMFLAANNGLYSGADAAAIKTVFTDKGLYFELASLSLTPSTVVGGNTATGEVVLTGPAPVGGATVELSSLNVAASVPSTVVVPQGTTSQTFTVSTSVVSSDTAGDIHAAYDEKDLGSTLHVTP